MFGVDGDTGKVTDMKEYGLLESASVKIQTLKTAIEVGRFILSVPYLSLMRSSPQRCCCEWTTLSRREDPRKEAEGAEEVCRRWERWERTDLQKDHRRAVYFQNHAYASRHPLRQCPALVLTE